MQRTGRQVNLLKPPEQSAQAHPIRAAPVSVRKSKLSIYFKIGSCPFSPEQYLVRCPMPQGIHSSLEIIWPQGKKSTYRAEYHLSGIALLGGKSGNSLLTYLYRFYTFFMVIARQISLNKLGTEEL